jgi:predicted AAA+ superfamily ATPase
MGQGKVLLLFGPRQAGKTTLLKSLAAEQDSVWLNGDESDVKVTFEKPSSARLKRLAGKAKVLILDEAQTIPNIGIGLKLLADEAPEITVIASGSSAFELADKLSEPLTGRKYEFRMLPFSFEELSMDTSIMEEKRLLESRLVFGAYPEVVNKPDQAVEILNLLTSSYLYKDVFQYGNVKKPQLLEKLLQALALQVGHEVSFMELSRLVGVDKETIERYIDLLEKAFVVFRLSGFSRNLRTELKKSKKIYFYDNGVRNAIIKNFNPLALRNDVGALWENHMMAERLKFNWYHQNLVNTWFWRTVNQQEIDYLEESGGKINAWEFKWSAKGKEKFPQSFLDTCSVGSQMVVSNENMEDFLLPPM